MKKLSFLSIVTLLFILLFCTTSFAQKNVAVLEIERRAEVVNDISRSEAMEITNVIRAEAVNRLPRARYSVMTTETIMSMGGAVAADCADENCVITIGRRIDADYIVRGTLSKFRSMFTLNVEMFETDYGNLVATSAPIRSANLEEILDKSAAVCADMYRKFVSDLGQAAPQTITQPPVVAPAPSPEPVMPPSPVYTDTGNQPPLVADKAQPSDSGIIEDMTAIHKPSSKSTSTTPQTASGLWAAALPIKHGICFASSSSGIMNPAFINEENYMTARFLFAQTLSEFNKIEAGFTMPLGLYEAIGISWMNYGVSLFDATDSEGRGRGVNVGDNTNYFALSYARNVWSGLTVAANANFIMHNAADRDGDIVTNKTMIGFGFDLGLTYKVIRHDMFGNHMVGLSANNIFNMLLDTDEKYAAALRFSLLSDFWERRIYFGTDFVLKDILTSDELFDDGKNLPWELTHKVGANILRIFKLYLLAGSTPDGFDHYGFAFGANMPGFFNGRDIEAMVQYVSLTGESDISSIVFSARVEFGKHRKDISERNRTFYKSPRPARTSGQGALFY